MNKMLKRNGNILDKSQLVIKFINIKKGIYNILHNNPEIIQSYLAAIDFRTTDYYVENGSIVLHYNDSTEVDLDYIKSKLYELSLNIVQHDNSAILSSIFKLQIKYNEEGVQIYAYM